MTVSSRFALAAHVLSLINLPHAGGPLSSDDLACSAGVNPVIIRGVSGMLRRAGLVTSRQGVAGLQLTRPARDITLLDIYRAAQPPTRLIALHEHPSAECMVGRGIQGALDEVCTRAQQALENELAGVTLEMLTAQLLERSAEPSAVTSDQSPVTSKSGASPLP